MVGGCVWAIANADSCFKIFHTHTPAQISWFLFWSTQLLLGPYYFFVFALLWVIDGLAFGRWLPRYNEPLGRSILVTGCDTGFGHDLAIELAAKGWRVYAGCLTEQGMASLKEKVIILG